MRRQTLLKAMLNTVFPTVMSCMSCLLKTSCRPSAVHQVLLLTTMLTTDAVNAS